MKIRPVREYFSQFLFSLAMIPQAIAFIKKKRLWEGVLSYGWVSRILLIGAVIGGFKFMGIFLKWMGHMQNDSPQAVVSQMGVLAKDLAIGSYDLLFSSGSKFIMLALLEVAIFHFARRALAELTGKDKDITWNDFVVAEIRMIKVTGLSWLFTLLFSIGFSIFFGIFGFLAWMKPILNFGVQCFFLGFAVLDNYQEQFHMGIRESLKFSQNFIGVAMALGIFLYFVLMVPIAGAVAAPCIAAVAATMVMYKLSDLHLHGVNHNHKPKYEEMI